MSHVIPIVLHHGFLSGEGVTLANLPGAKTFSSSIERVITDRGHPLIITRVHPVQSIAYRAAQLKSQLLPQILSRKPGQRRCIIIAHSMGGLDARYMISKLGMADYVAALLTICTPHRGSPFADWLMNNIDNVPMANQVLARVGLDWPSVRDLTVKSMKQFNQDVPDAKGVKYYSVGGDTTPIAVPKFMFFTHDMIQKLEGDNDGIVSIASSKWGTYLGTWPVDHLWAINRRIAVASIVGGDISHLYRDALDRVAINV
jgi:triacylglycerol lipase